MGAFGVSLGLERPAGRRAQPQRILATGGMAPFNTPLFTATSSFNVLHSRTRHRIGVAGFRSMALALCNYAVDVNNQEIGTGSAVDVEASILMNGMLKQLSWGGATSATMADGAALLLSDVLAPEDFGLTAATSTGALFYCVVRRRVPVGNTMVLGGAPAVVQPSGQPARSISAIVSNDAVNQVMSGGALTTGPASDAAVLGPLGFVGTPYLSTTKALLAIGDSIAQGALDNGYSNASDGSNGGGFIARACYDQSGGGGSTPFVNLGRTGSRISDYTAANTAKRAQLYRYATHALVGGGTNDLFDNVPIATVMAAQRATWAALKAAGVTRVEQAPIPPRTTGTFSTVAGQTPIGGYETGGAKRDPLNAAYAANVGADGLDAILDLNATYVADGAQPDRWQANKTGDGVHPNATASSNIGSLLYGRVGAWSAA